VLRWPLGLVRTTWRYLTRRVPVHRSETGGDRSDLPGPLPAAVLDDQVQSVEHGVGPLLHRRYAVVVDGPRTSPEELIRIFAGRPNRAAPADAAVFVKTRGDEDEMRVSDEFLIRMPGPWDGPVRVVDTTPTSFRLATLRGHLEAGQIEFRARREGDALRFEIESSARPGDRLSHVLYNLVPVAKEIQLNLWVETCLRLAARSGGRLRGGVDVHTRRVAEDLLPG
jgi:hypothetical protein